MTRPVSIGPNLFARTKMSVIEQYWAKQAACPHTKRDPKGKCYACGQEERPFAGIESHPAETPDEDPF